jgi:hypothetical protein
MGLALLALVACAPREGLRERLLSYPLTPDELGSPDSSPQPARKGPRLLPTRENVEFWIGDLPDTAGRPVESEACRQLHAHARWLYAFLDTSALLEEYRDLAVSPDPETRFMARRMVLEITTSDPLPWAREVFATDPSPCHRCWAGLTLFAAKARAAPGRYPDSFDRRGIEDAMLEAMRARGRPTRRSRLSELRVWDDWASARTGGGGGWGAYALHRQGLTWHVVCRYEQVIV